MKKIGLVGAGAIAQAYVDAFREIDFAVLEAVADIRPEAGAALAEAAGCKSFDSHEAMAEGADLDAAIVCTPPVTHPDIAIHLLKRNIAVLCEKPFAVDEASAREIITVANENDTLVTMASKFRYVDDVIHARAVVASGLLGDIHLMENTFVSPVNMTGRWNSRPEVSGGGVWIDNGSHSVDIVRYLLGPIVELQLVTDTFGSDLDVEDNALMVARTVGGTRARADLSWTFDKQFKHFIRLYGSSGTLNIGWQGSAYKQASSSDWVEFGTGYRKVDAFRANLKNFCEALENRQVLRITAEDALASVQVVQAGYVSAHKRMSVHVPRTDETALKPEVIRLAGE